MGGHTFTPAAANTTLFYTDSGPNTTTTPAILLLHGWTCDVTDWSFQLPLLLLLGYRVLSLDLRGHGRSSPAPTPLPSNYTSLSQYYSPSAFASDASALLTHLDIAAPALVMGHSLGGSIAATLAVRHPEQIKGAVLVDSAYYFNQSAAAPLLAAGRESPEAAAASFEAGGAGYSEHTPAWIKAWRRVRTWGTRADVVRGAIEGLFGDAESEGLWENAEPLLREGLGDGGVPRLVVVQDRARVEKEAQIGLGPGDRVEVLNESHWLHQQGAETFNWILEDWLREMDFLP
ncbi:Protein abhd8 [Diplodia seriata]